MWPKEYLQKGNYFWNSGMFAFSAKTFRQEMALHAPEIVSCMAEAAKRGKKGWVIFSPRL